MTDKTEGNRVRLNGEQIFNTFGNSEVGESEQRLMVLREKLKKIREHKWDPEFSDKIDKVENLELELEEKIAVLERKLRNDINKFSDIHGGK